MKAFRQDNEVTYFCETHAEFERYLEDNEMSKEGVVELSFRDALNEIIKMYEMDYVCLI